MKHITVKLPVWFSLCFGSALILSISTPSLAETFAKSGSDSHSEPGHTGQKDNPSPGVDLSGILKRLSNQDIKRARNELAQLQMENPGWLPPLSLTQMLNGSAKYSEQDKQYLLLMAELDAVPESKRSGIPRKKLELASNAIQQRQDGYHAMMLGWIYFQRQEYPVAEKLFTQAGEWGKPSESKQARSLVALRLAHQAVTDNDHTAALHHAKRASSLGNNNSYTSTGWMLFKKEAYDDAFTAFSQAPASQEKEDALAETCFQQSRLALEDGNDALADQLARCSQQHGRGDAMSALGWTLYKEAKYTRASQFFGAQIPPSEESFYGNALSLKASGDALKARELACQNGERSHRIQAICIELFSTQMLADYKAERHDAVIRQAKELEKYGELNEDLRALVAWSELAIGHYRTAANHFDHLLTKQPDEPSHANGLLDSLSHSNNPASLNDARKRHPQLDRILNQKKYTSASPPAQPKISRVRANPSNKIPTARNDADRLSQAIDLYHAKEYEKSNKLFQELRPGIIEDKDSGLLTLAGWAAFHVGEYRQARDDFQTAAKWTYDPKIWLSVAEAEIALQNPDRAREIIDDLPPSKERDSMASRLTALQAHAAYRNNEYAKAESLFNDPNIKYKDNNLEMLGWSRYQQDKYTTAASAFETAYRTKPTLASAKGLVFSYVHLQQPRKLIALSDELQGPLAGLTSDKAVREKLDDGDEEWVGVSSEGVLIVREPPDKTSVFTRGLQKLEGIPGFTWGSVDHNFMENETDVSFILNQGIDWFVLPGDITVNTFLEYRSMHNDLRSVYDQDEVVFGLELQRTPFNFGIERSPAQWRDGTQEQDLTTAYFGWYHSWYKYLRRRHSKASNPFNVNAYAGSTYGRISRQLDNGPYNSARGFVRQGMDWFTSVTAAGELTLNTYAAYRFRFRTENNFWYDAHGPALGIELQREPFSLGLDYAWQISPRRHTTEDVFSLYLTWYYDWNLKPY